MVVQEEDEELQVFIKLIIPPKISVSCFSKNLFGTPLMLNNWRVLHNFFITELDEFHRLSMISNFCISFSLNKQQASRNELETLRQIVQAFNQANMIKKDIKFEEVTDLVPTLSMNMLNKLEYDEAFDFRYTILCMVGQDKASIYSKDWPLFLQTIQK